MEESEQSKPALPALATLSERRQRVANLKVKLNSLKVKSDGLNAELENLENELNELEQPWTTAWLTLRDSKEALETAKTKNLLSIEKLAGLKERAESCLGL